MAKKKKKVEEVKRTNEITLENTIIHKHKLTNRELLQKALIKSSVNMSDIYDYSVKDDVVIIVLRKGLKKITVKRKDLE